MMKLIEGFSQGNWELSLWSDAIHRVNTSIIKNLVELVADRLDLQFSVKARYFNEHRHWVISFFRIGGGERIICDHTIDPKVLSRNYIDGIASEISDRITNIIRSEENQSWVIVNHRDGFLAGIHQAGKTSVSLILHEVTQDRNFATNHIKVTIEAWAGGNAIVRGGSVEVGGMLLQGELLEWHQIGEEIRFRFSPNTHHVNVSGSSPDEIRIAFATHPRTPRLASFYGERISRLMEQGQIEIPRSGYFDQFLEALSPRGGRFEFPNPRQDLEQEQIEISRSEYFYCFLESPPYSERITPSTVGRWQGYDAGSEYEGLGLRSCKYNSGSRMIRCAVNPCGPCEGCQHYEKI